LEATGLRLHAFVLSYDFVQHHFIEFASLPQNNQFFVWVTFM